MPIRVVEDVSVVAWQAEARGSVANEAADLLHYPLT
jgi:hypothetical protein